MILTRKRKKSILVRGCPKSKQTKITQLWYGGGFNEVGDEKINNYFILSHHVVVTLKMRSTVKLTIMFVTFKVNPLSLFGCCFRLRKWDMESCGVEKDTFLTLKNMLFTYLYIISPRYSIRFRAC